MINLILALEKRKENLWKEVGICNRYIDKGITSIEWQAEKEKKLKEIDEVEAEIKELQERQNGIA